jgi:hypothetical protein
LSWIRKILLVLKLREESPDHRWSGAKCIDFPATRQEDAFFDREFEEDCVDLCNGTSDGLQCPLREQCMRFALVNGEKFGIWGGMSELSRLAVLKKHPRINKRANPDWKHMTEQEALDGLTVKEIASLRAELQYDE